MIDEHGYPCTREKSSLMMLALGSSLMLRYSFAECFCPEKELERLLRRAVGENPCSERLKEALIKQSWDGNITFCMFSSELTAVCRARRRKGKRDKNDRFLLTSSSSSRSAFSFRACRCLRKLSIALSLTCLHPFRYPVRHFRVPLCLGFKARISAKPFF